MTRNSSLNARRGEAVAGWLMAAPALILLLAFLTVPFIMAFGLAFTNQRLISPQPTEFVGAVNFQKLLTVRPLIQTPLIDDKTGKPALDENGALTYPPVRSLTRNNPQFPDLNGLQELALIPIGENRLAVLAGDPVFIRSIINILTFVLFVVPIQGGLSLLLAMLINSRTRGINLFRTVYFMPVVISMVVVSILWKIIYDPNSGLLNNLLSAATFGVFTPVDWLGTPSTALPAIIAMSVWQGVGFHMVIWLAGLQTIPGVLYEAASVEGANTWQQFKYVTWQGCATRPSSSWSRSPWPRSACSPKST